MDGLRTFSDTIPALVWFVRSNGSLESANAQFTEFTGKPLEQMRSICLNSFVHPDDQGKLTLWWNNLVSSSPSGEIELRLRRGDSTYRWFLVHAKPSITEDVWCILGVDIDTRKASEENLFAKEAELRTITDAVSQYIVVLDREGNVLYVNRVVSEQTGLIADDVSSTSGGFARPFHPDDLERVALERTEGLLRGEAFQLEVRVLLKSNEYRWYLMQYKPWKNEDGCVVRWYVTGTDIDSQKKEREQLRIENVALREELSSAGVFSDLVGSSVAMHAVHRQLHQVSKSDATVLILGETGTGKELIARAVHQLSERNRKPFIRVNCAAIPQSLIASELFGHEKGAFTGALQRRQGKFEAADGGTLFLDEVGDLPMETQVALLRALQEREFERIGSNIPISVNIRLVAATHRDLAEAIEAGTFREDLFYRLNVLPITAPPLRERLEDIPLLVERFVARYAQRSGKVIRRIEKQTLELMQKYSWPGNVRELQNVIERAVILSDTETLFFDRSWLCREEQGHSLPLRMESVSVGFPDLAKREIAMIKEALQAAHGRISGPNGAASRLGIPRQTLESKMKKLGISKSELHG